MNTTLTMLDLRTNRLDDDAGAAIGTYLKTRGSKVSTLLLSDNEIGPDGGKAIAAGWSDTDVLSSLDIRGNKLDVDAVKALKAARGSSARKKTRTVELLIDE